MDGSWDSRDTRSDTVTSWGNMPSAKRSCSGWKASFTKIIDTFLRARRASGRVLDMLCRAAFSHDMTMAKDIHQLLCWWALPADHPYPGSGSRQVSEQLVMPPPASA